MNPVRRDINLLIGAALILFFFLEIGCSTKKNTFNRRFYHNLTSHYNAYWNGNESYKEGVLELSKKVYDNFNQVLPIYNYGKKNDALSLNPYMDKAIEKASVVIQRHSMKFGGREYVRWIDDCYMLLGKSYFYKQEYISARRTFNFVIAEYPYNSIKYNAQLWLAKTYNQMGQFEKSEPLLKALQEEADNVNIPFKVRKEIPLVLANTYLLQGNYSKAVTPLYEGIEINTNRDIVTRLEFILAQILQKEGDLDEASKYYLDVIRRNPPYEMAFQAKISLARTYDAQSGSSDQIVKTLNKMLRDVKNKEFKDQVYFALAEVAFKDNQDSLGIDYLKLSVASSSQNVFQKTTSALQLAEIYFENNAYEDAGAYYDTAMQAIPEDFPDIDQVRERAEILAELVDNLMVVQMQDSLQYLAGLSEEERLAIVDNIITQLIEEEQKQMEEEFFRQQMMFDQQQGGFDVGSTEGGWYFYNMGAKSQGYNEFVRKWGKRKLEDLWRLSNKTVFSFEEQGEDLMASDTIPSDSAALASTDPKSREYYLQNIPLTPEQLQSSDEMLIDAFYNLGRLYKEGLNDLPRSKQSYNELLQRFPDNPYLLEVYYNLYKIFEAENDLRDMNFYKDLILNDFPESDFAHVIENPNYFQDLAAAQNEEEKLYHKTYNAFKEGQYFLVINYGDLAMSTYQDTNLLPKFEYLRALSLGKVEVVDTLVVALQNLVASYPKSEVTPLAQNILMKIRSQKDGTIEEEETEDFVSPYTYTPDESHFFVVIAKKDSINVSALKVRLSDFDKNYFGLRKLNINSILLDPVRYMVTVGNFVNAEDAMNYYNLISNDEYVFGNIRPINYQKFVVATPNYPVLYNEKNTLVYYKFFEKYYLEN